MAKPQKAAELPQAQSGRTALEVATALAREAGAVLLSHFHEKRQVRHKGRSDLVSDADLLVDKLLKDKLQGEYPDFALL
ncbi:MAG: inositol monophosphatase family protein, partial [Chloroflexota bacterium]|nr:inositol monophosphatase family protein [Chloroflexota bacterium]